MNKRIWAWAIYDWGNSAYTTTVMAGFFPVFFKQYWSAGADATITTGRLGDLTSATGLIVALMTPFLGAMADARSAKKKYLGLFMILGLVGCFGLGFVGQGGWFLAGGLYALATIGFNSSCTFYDSLLPSVAADHECDRASALGYSMGYLGGGILFAVNVAMFLKPHLFGIPDGATAVQYSFMSVAVWWALFSLPLFWIVPEGRTASARVPLNRAFRQAFRQLRETFRDVWQNESLRYLLLAFWLYIDGVYTVMTMAVDFGLSVGFQDKDLIGALLLVQFIGFPSAYLFGHSSERLGAKRLIQICIAAYAVATALAAFMSEAWHFYALAVFIGIVQGGVQALSRSLYARMIPSDKSAEYFGVMNMVGRFAAILGPFLVGHATLLTGSHRWGLMSLLILFAGGSYFLARVKIQARH